MRGSCSSAMGDVSLKQELVFYPVVTLFWDVDQGYQGHTQRFPLAGFTSLYYPGFEVTSLGGGYAPA